MANHIQMTPEQFAEALNRVSVANRREMGELTKSIVSLARAPARSAVDVWQSSNPDLSEKARHVLVDFDDLSVAPLLDADLPNDPAKKAWMIEHVVVSHIALRERIVTRLEKLLGDKSLIPPPRLRRPVEEPTPQKRVCDQAYIAMRQLLNIQEDSLTSLMNVETFLHLPVDLRDKEIEKARSLKVWTQLVEDAAEE